eukprot:SAG31_NODE_1270_length_9065_cov_7.007473_9_plen_162_part_00
MCCQHIHSTGCSSPSLRGRPVYEPCRGAAATQVPPNLPQHDLELRCANDSSTGNGALWWCCTVRARDICGVQKELRWVLGGAVLVGTSRRTILAPLSGLELGALGLVSGEAGLAIRRRRPRDGTKATRTSSDNRRVGKPRSQRAQRTSGGGPRTQLHLDLH